jgi:hypothetical protein
MEWCPNIRGTTLYIGIEAQLVCLQNSFTRELGIFLREEIRRWNLNFSTLCLFCLLLSFPLFSVVLFFLIFLTLGSFNGVIMI